jgi:hypothetical protein
MTRLEQEALIKTLTVISNRIAALEAAAQSHDHGEQPKQATEHGDVQEHSQPEIQKSIEALEKALTGKP